MSAQIFDVNPYENHPELTQTEAEVLWEYAKLNQRLKIMIAETKRLSQVPEEHLLKDMRQVETKMGFVLTLFQASVWGVINERAAAADTRDDEDLDTTTDKTVMQ
ncbi:DASH complex subunit Dad3-domain-containing protein [Thelephora terrestris]|uniref:DASH complex subunit DAD3 n=1 Tax=Thelephora terrestris TaxID=56493 RepID=A0A9P6H9F9_9AGAM|nr:DASH complex subunit Dad3-domain-containing protein [Thelephora terrestris]